MIIFSMLIGLSNIQAQTLSSSWYGSWMGTLEIYSDTGITQSLKMELTISPTDSTGIWDWTILYHLEEKDERKYQLIAVGSPGQFQIDEQNSIILDLQAFGDFMISRFVVNNTMLSISYRLSGENLLFEVISGPENSPRVTGQEVEFVERILSYPIAGYQFAKLSKVEE
ncbi:hypothetical protein [Pontibacter sp. G13]|uniref:hypothetical protein n=1 Tax=Pontibacter sp. G13 TaxID=3074898 RepID=UPI00288B10FC|nr:hypothetical protein [Pontibacter sp. G13]WNJ15933.1 hypothetical protein RJD25_13800 [Pontibacter sp. G13]